MTPKTLYTMLEQSYGPQHWWPARTGFEIMVGAILTQNTSWANVEKAIRRLKKEKLLTVQALASANKNKVAKAVKSAGYYNQKTEHLILLARHLKKYPSLKTFLAKPLRELKEELLSLKGIGPETADSIILYAAKKPVFVIDAYTKRLNKRLALSTEQSYEGLQQFFQKKLSNSERLYNEFHALIVRHCRDLCRSKPLCGECFLNSGCPHANRS